MRVAKTQDLTKYLTAMINSVVHSEEFWEDLEREVDEEEVASVIEQLNDFIFEKFKDKRVIDLLYAIYALLHAYVTLYLIGLSEKKDVEAEAK
jgi:hypothetical protein